MGYWLTAREFEARFTTSLDAESSRMYFGRSRESCDRVASRRKGEIASAAAKLVRDRERNHAKQIAANRKPDAAELRASAVARERHTRAVWAENALRGLKGG